MSEQSRTPRPKHNSKRTRCTDAWLHHILQEGAISLRIWQNSGLNVRTNEAYAAFLDFSKQQRDYKPDGKSLWAKKIRARLGLCVANKRETTAERARLFAFHLLPTAGTSLQNP